MEEKAPREGDAVAIAGGLTGMMTDRVGDESTHVWQEGHGMRVGIKSERPGRVEQWLFQGDFLFADGDFLIKPH